MVYTENTDAQILKTLGKKAEKAAERALERRVEKETTEKTEMVLDSIFEPGSKNEGKENSPRSKTHPSKTTRPKNPINTSSPSTMEDSNPSNTNELPTLNVYSKFDFVPGDKLLFFDDFSNDFIGDFPVKWNSNSGGELVEIHNEPDKWLKLSPGFTSQYIPDVTGLPKEFTVEFDVITTGLNKKTSSQSYLSIVVGDNNSFDKPKNFGMVEYPFCQFIDAGIIVENNINGKRALRNTIATDIRKIVLKKHHIAIAVNEQRFRMWSNEQKIVDVPRLLPTNVQMNAIKIGLRGIDTTVEGIYISNMKVAKGGVDLRRRLLSEGNISTNGILFDSGSANILPRSMGIIRQIYQVLQQDEDLKLKIVGHTDADGDDALNMELSKKRAEAVKNALATVYNVSSNRLQTEGKGASEPLSDNSTAEGKSMNRRVEFIRLAKTNQ
ncbi:OmpA family protein [Aggregatimonas sangjinii]|uniref:OmpA family protein n=2 Tax=Aggregatimonas sangjinii TaxID=2583587 RepID=A0A5B7SUP6_9FLAO|nr:OmpA family protein [Aggregatimonas sangjinii]